MAPALDQRTTYLNEVGGWRSKTLVPMAMLYGAMMLYPHAKYAHQGDLFGPEHCVQIAFTIPACLFLRAAAPALRRAQWVNSEAPARFAAEINRHRDELAGMEEDARRALEEIDRLQITPESDFWSKRGAAAALREAAERTASEAKAGNATLRSLHDEFERLRAQQG